MTLLVPLGLAAAALVAPLALWYVLRSRRPRVEVASTFLWARTDRSVAAAVPWQRFRPDRTFWLVLLAILVGALALARPAVPVAAELGEHTILVVDTSASMLANEDGPSRLELARRDAAALIDRLGPGQTVSIVEAGPRGRVLISGSDDPRQARGALNGLRASHGAADLADAFTLAAALQRAGQDTVTYLFTDGPLPPEAARVAPAGLIARGVGRDRPNLAVTRLQALPAGAGTAQAFVQVRNFGQLATDVTVTLSVGRTVLVEQSVPLSPRGTEDLIVPVDYGAVAAGGPIVLQASVAPVGADVTGAEATDALSVDDAAWAVVAEPRDVDVLLVGAGNVFLESALASVPGVEVRLSPTLPASLDGIDLLVVDRVAAPASPTVPTLYVAPATPPAGVTVDGEAELPVVTFQDPAHQLLVDVDLADVAIAAAQRVRAPALQALAAGPGGPLLLAGRLGAAPVVYLGFDLLASNLPLQVAWPVLVANAVAWLAGPPVTPPAVAGSEALLPVPTGATAITVTPPAGDDVPVDVTRPRVRVDQVGVWAVAYGGDAQSGPAALAVNPDPAEGDLARGQPALPEGTMSPSRGGDATPTDGRRAFGRELLVVVLGVLLAEWVWTQRPPRRRGRAVQLTRGSPER